LVSPGHKSNLYLIMDSFYQNWFYQFHCLMIIESLMELEAYNLQLISNNY